METPAANSQLSALARAVLGETASPTSVPLATDQPAPKLDLARMCFELVMRGIDPEQIVEITGLTKDKVDQILLSAWFENEAKQRVKSDGEDPESLRSYLRALAFKASIQLGKLLTNTNPQVQLSAIKTTLEYSIRPMKMVDTSNGTSRLDLQKVKEEIASMEAKLSVLRRRNGA